MDAVTVGTSVTWQARHFGIRWEMTSYISEYERPYRFVEEQLRGPFRTWRYEHLFVAPDPNATTWTSPRDPSRRSSAPYGTVTPPAHS